MALMRINQNVRNYRVIFMDYSMPGMNGVETSKKIFELLRSNGVDPSDEHQGTEICIISAHQQFSYIQETIDIGVKHFLMKPINLIAIKNLLRDLSFKLEENGEQSDE